MGSGTPVRREIELDFVRGIAILAVMFFHYRTRTLLITCAPIVRLQSFGWAGVDLFFVLSGFLVGGLLVREWQQTGRVHAWRFLKRRGFKIWPAYYVFLLAAVALRSRPLASFFWQNLLNVQNYWPSSLAHTWSLAIEEHFYLALAALLAYVTSHKWTPDSLLRLCLGLALAVEVLRAALLLQGHPVYYYTHTRMDALLIGVALAVTRTWFPAAFQKIQRQRLALYLVCAVALVALWKDHSADPILSTSPVLLTLVDYGAAALLLLLYRPHSQRTRPRSLPYRWVARIGIYSYGIYLWHISVLRPVDWATAHVSPAGARWVATLLPFGLAVAVGTAMTKLVELPALRLRERLVPSTMPEAPIPVPAVRAAELG